MPTSTSSVADDRVSGLLFQAVTDQRQRRFSRPFRLLRQLMMALDSLRAIRVESILTGEASPAARQQELLSARNTSSNGLTSKFVRTGPTD